MGALAGHLAHMQENLDFTFGELKSVIGSVVSGATPVLEKVDGQNIFFKFTVDLDTGSVRTARNKGNLMKGGMSPDEFTAKWVGHPAEGAFVNGFKAIESALDQLDPASLESIFDPSSEGGQRYINAEIVYTGKPNVINYGGDYIVMHNLQEFSPEGKLDDVQLSGGDFQQLVSGVESAQAELDDDSWSVVGPQVLELRDMSGEQFVQDFYSDLDALGITDSMSIADYVEDQLRQSVVGDLPIPVNKQEDLIKRIVGIGRKLNADEYPSLADIKAGTGREVGTQISAIGTKVNAGKVVGRMTKPIELAIHDLAIEVLRGVASALTGDHDAEIKRLKAELESAKSAIESARDAGSDARREMLKTQLDKLGSSDNIASSAEGIVFEHPPGSKALYKLTGAFAPLNQIIGAAMRIPQEKNEALVREYVREFIGGSF